MVFYLGGFLALEISVISQVLTRGEEDATTFKSVAFSTCLAPLLTQSKVSELLSIVFVISS